MKRICILFLFSLVSVSLNAQYNLVPNPSFEIFDTCPNNFGQVYYAIPWTNPSLASPDYYNACSSNSNTGVPLNYCGNEPARTGNGYGLIVTALFIPNFPQFNSYREYLQVQLTDSLIANVDYCIQFYVSAGDSMLYISNNIGAYFSPVQIQDSVIHNLPYIPQFENPATNNLNSRNGWTLVSGTYNATGGEKYIVIGNFRDTTATIATYTGWASNPAYYNAAYYIDDVLITPCDSLTEIEEHQLKSDINIYPNPSNGIYTLNEKTGEIETIEVFDVLGNIVYYNKQLKNTPVTIDITTQPKGVYILKVFRKNKSSQFKLIKN